MGVPHGPTKDRPTLQAPCGNVCTKSVTCPMTLQADDLNASMHASRAPKHPLFGRAWPLLFSVACGQTTSNGPVAPLSWKPPRKPTRRCAVEGPDGAPWPGPDPSPAPLIGQQPGGPVDAAGSLPGSAVVSGAESTIIATNLWHLGNFDARRCALCRWSTLPGRLPARRLPAQVPALPTWYPAGSRPVHVLMRP